MKTLTREQVEAKKAKAVQFLRDVVGDDAKADAFADMDVDDYAERKRIQIINPRRNTMPGGGNGPTKQDLLDQIEDLQPKNQDLQDQLDAIYDIVAPSDEEE